MTRHDLRVKRTQKYLKMAFISLLQEKVFHKVSVQALTQRAEINRVTFYLHYQDMDDFVEQFVQGLLEEIKGILQAAEKEMEMHDAMLHVLVSLLEYIASNAHVYDTLLVNKGIPKFTPRLVELLRSQLLQPDLQEANPILKHQEVPEEIAVWYATSALVGTISLWLGEGMPYSPHYLAEQMIELNPFRTEIIPVNPDKTH